MARYLFVSDPLISSVLGTVVLPANQPFQLWTDRSGGTLVTDCTAPDGITTLSSVNGYFTADGSGKPPDFRGPDGIVMLWLDAGAGRFPVVAVDLLAQLLGSSIGWLAGNFPGGTGGVTDHGALSGLGDDDHPQYHNDARGDLRYFTQAQVAAAINAAVNTSSTADRNRANHSGTQLASSISDFSAAVQAAGGGTGGTSITVHGQLSGLSADDHPQYLTATRGDARYNTQAQVTAAINSAVSTSSTADRNRANHSGTQLASSISDFTSAVQAVAGTGTLADNSVTAAKIVDGAVGLAELSGPVLNTFPRTDAAQTLSTGQKAQARSNIGVGFTIAGARLATDPLLSDAQALALYGEGAFFTVDPA